MTTYLNLNSDYLSSLRQWNGQGPRPTHPLEVKLASINNWLQIGCNNFFIEPNEIKENTVVIHKIRKTSIGIHVTESITHDISPLLRLIEETNISNYSKWMDLCFFEQNGEITYDRFYDKLAIGEGASMTNGEYLAQLQSIVSTLGFQQGDIVVIDDCRLTHKPIQYLLLEKGVKSIYRYNIPNSECVSVMPAELPSWRLFYGETSIQPCWHKTYFVEIFMDSTDDSTIRLLPEAIEDFVLVYAQHRHRVSVYSIRFDGDCFGNTFMIARNSKGGVKVTMMNN